MRSPRRVRCREVRDRLRLRRNPLIRKAQNTVSIYGSYEAVGASWWWLDGKKATCGDYRSGKSAEAPTVNPGHKSTIQDGTGAAVAPGRALNGARPIYSIRAKLPNHNHSKHSRQRRHWKPQRVIEGTRRKQRAAHRSGDKTHNDQPKVA
jgi:hypothetical protein